MKTAIILATIGLFTTSTLSVAQDGNLDCGLLGTLAATIMTSRQKEMPMSQVMGTAGGHELIKQMIKTAYSEPAFLTEENRAQAVSKFRNAIEFQCFKAQGK